jgi:predicted KAP-like P-loop ATPase
MWADNETTTDLLNVRHLVQVISDTIQTERLLPLTIGVYGGWGSGKSSLVHMVRADLERKEGIVCISFNGWLFESYEDAKSALMGTILDEIRTRSTLGAKAQALLGKLSARVDWFRVMSLAGKGALTLALGGVPGALTGLQVTGAAMKSLARKAGEKAVTADPEKLEGLVRQKDEPDTEEPVHAIRTFREDFVELLEETKIKTLVVFIDELDRCIPETVVQTLEAIRLFLFAERTAFVIGADERLVQHAVRQRFKLEGMDPQIGADYLEKMIQIPFRIPPLGRREIHTYMNLLFTELHCDAGAFRELVEELDVRERGPFGELTFSFEDARELLRPLPRNWATASH